jgi:hypothetical protein
MLATFAQFSPACSHTSECHLQPETGYEGTSGEREKRHCACLWGEGERGTHALRGGVQVTEHVHKRPASLAQHLADPRRGGSWGGRRAAVERVRAAVEVAQQHHVVARRQKRRQPAALPSAQRERSSVAAGGIPTHTVEPCLDTLRQRTPHPADGEAIHAVSTRPAVISCVVGF